MVTADPEHASFDAEVVDEAGNRYVCMHGYRTARVADQTAGAPVKTLSAVA